MKFDSEHVLNRVTVKADALTPVTRAGNGAHT